MIYENPQVLPKLHLPTNFRAPFTCYPSMRVLLNRQRMLTLLMQPLCHGGDGVSTDEPFCDLSSIAFQGAGS